MSRSVGEKDYKRIDKGNIKTQVRRILKGHFGKIYSAHWASDSLRLVSASQDGKLVIWNALTTNKLSAISLKSSWVMACSYGPSDQGESSLVASGGLDNTVTLYEVDAESKSSDNPKCELNTHEGYVSCIRFMPKGTPNLLSASGDSTCILWDYNKAQPLRKFEDHKSDVMSISICPGNANWFVSGACDAKARVWDVRNDGKKSALSFEAHDSDINGVVFMKNGYGFVSGSDDSSCFIWDLRYNKAPMQMLSDSKVTSGVTSLDFSHSGRVVVASYDDNLTPLLWDSITGQCIGSLGMGNTGYQHEERISCIAFSPQGTAICTASWDMFLKIWA